jgi:hypothetical protein
MIENMVGSTFSSSYVHGVVDENSNSYRNMIMDVMRMNQGYSGKYLIIDEEQNADATWFFYLLKDSDKPLWNAQIIINYWSLHRCSP